MHSWGWVLTLFLQSGSLKYQPDRSALKVCVQGGHKNMTWRCNFLMINTEPPTQLRAIFSFLISPLSLLSSCNRYSGVAHHTVWNACLAGFCSLIKITQQILRCSKYNLVDLGSMTERPQMPTSAHAPTTVCTKTLLSWRSHMSFPLCFPFLMPWQLERIALCRQQLLGDRNRSARVDQGEAARSSYSKRKKKKKKDNNNKKSPPLHV